MFCFSYKNGYPGYVQQIPAFYRAEFNVSGQPLDTFLLTNGWDNLDNWGQGFVLING